MIIIIRTFLKIPAWGNVRIYFGKNVEIYCEKKKWEFTPDISRLGQSKSWKTTIIRRTTIWETGAFLHHGDLIKDSGKPKSITTLRNQSVWESQFNSHYADRTDKMTFSCLEPQEMSSIRLVNIWYSTRMSQRRCTLQSFHFNLNTYAIFIHQIIMLVAYKQTWRFNKIDMGYLSRV